MHTFQRGNTMRFNPVYWFFRLIFGVAAIMKKCIMDAITDAVEDSGI